jgi:hypothetical protein
MAVTITHVFLWGSSATNHIENALMGSPWQKQKIKKYINSVFLIDKNILKRFNVIRF